MVKIMASFILLPFACLFACSDPNTQSIEAEATMAETGIYDAAVFGEFEKVEDLLKRDPTLVNMTDEYGFTPLHGVAGEHYFEMARLLVSKGADVNARNEDRVTALHLAAYPEMVEILVASGAALEARDSNGRTPLHAATEHPELVDVMERLLQLGADVNARDNYGITPLDIATSREENDKVELLKSHGGLGGDAI